MMPKALVISGCPNSAADVYRVGNLKEELALLGWQYDHTHFSDLFSANRHLLDRVKNYQLIYSHRTPYSEEYARLIRNAEEYGIAAVYDTDDYIFDASIMPYVHAIKDWPPDRKEHYLNDLRIYEKALKLHKYGVAPTAYLAARMREKGLTGTFVLPNCLSAEMRVSAENALYDDIRRGNGRDGITIGFFSGTRTHDADFLISAPAIEKILKKHRQARLIVVGELEILEKWKIIVHRMERRPLVGISELHSQIVKTDINIAPLEPDNPYCQAKSELKYFDAGIVGIPTIASATESYRTAISSGSNGFLARTDGEWADYLELLVRDSGERQRVGLAAKLDTYARYTTATVYSRLGEILSEVL